MNDEMTTPRSLLQKISLFAAGSSYLSAVVTLYVLHQMVGEVGMEHVYSAALLATCIFFLGAGAVLQIIGTANLPDLSLPRDP